MPHSQLPKPRRSEGMVAIAIAVEREAGKRYSDVAGRLRRLRRPDVARLFGDLADYHASRATEIAIQAMGEGQADAPTTGLQALWPWLFIILRDVRRKAHVS